MDPNNQGYGQAQGYYNGQQQYNNGPPPKQYQQYEQGPPPQQYQQQQYQQYDNGGPGPQEQMPNPPSYGQNYSSPDGKAGFEQTFKVERPKWNDLWAGALLIVVFLGYVAISGYCLHSYASNSSLNNGGFSNTDNTFGLNGNTLVLFAFVLVAALVLGYAYVVMARMFTKQFIWISGILNICMTIATAVYQFYRHAYVGGVLFALLAVFTIICFISWIKRIPFSVLMFQTAVDVSKKFGHVYLVSFMGGLIAALFAAWFAATLVAVYIRFQPSNNNPACAAGGSGGDCSKATVIGLVVYITFAGYWITEWLKNTIHVTISGVYGAWYFNPNNPAKGATRGAAKRALTYSFGSIAFGSLIVAILDFLRFACSIARGNGGTGNPIADCAFCILQCILGLIQWAIEFVNRYAFSYIALYGKAYIASAKGTWKMIKDRGIDALINECLVGPVLSMGCLFVAVCCALIAYIYLDVTDPAYNEGGAFTGVIVVYAFLIGLQIASCFVVPINAGIDTIFVGMGWDPQCLMQQHGDLYQRMVQVYPHVQQAIHA